MTVDTSNCHPQASLPSPTGSVWNPGLQEFLTSWVQVCVNCVHQPGSPRATAEDRPSRWPVAFRDRQPRGRPLSHLASVRDASVDKWDEAPAAGAPCPSPRVLWVLAASLPQATACSSMGPCSDRVPSPGESQHLNCSHVPTHTHRYPQLPYPHLPSLLVPSLP